MRIQGITNETEAAFTTMRRAILAVAVLTATAGTGWSQTMRRYYTKERLAVMRENIAQNEWAR